MGGTAAAGPVAACRRQRSDGPLDGGRTAWCQRTSCCPGNSWPTRRRCQRSPGAASSRRGPGRGDGKAASVGFVPTRSPAVAGHQALPSRNLIPWWGSLRWGSLPTSAMGVRGRRWLAAPCPLCAQGVVQLIVAAHPKRPFCPQDSRAAMGRKPLTASFSILAGTITRSSCEPGWRGRGAGSSYTSSPPIVLIWTRSNGCGGGGVLHKHNAHNRCHEPFAEVKHTIPNFQYDEVAMNEMSIAIRYPVSRDNLGEKPRQSG